MDVTVNCTWLVCFSLLCFLSTRVISNELKTEGTIKDSIEEVNKKDNKRNIDEHSIKADGDNNEGYDKPLSAIFKRSEVQQCSGESTYCNKEEAAVPITTIDDYVPPSLPNGFIGPKFQRVHLALPRRELNEIGSVENITMNGRNMTVTILSHRPPVFEISNFLSDNETELMTEEAQEKGLREIKVATIPVNFPTELNERLYDDWDENFDGKISIDELYEVKELDNMMMSRNDIRLMYNRTDIDKDGDENLTYSEMNEAVLIVRDYLVERQKNRSEFKARGVKEAWLWHDDDSLLSYENLLEDYHERIQKVTGLPKVLVEQTEPIQVQKKERDAFTPCQYDSSNLLAGAKCCVFGVPDCQMCRFATLHMFLNDVEGGELIFPLADENESSSSSKMKNKLIERCEKVPQRNASNLVIPVKRGSAILWYNHEVARNTGWMSQLEQLSMTGMAQVVGDSPQWTARMWIDIVGDGVRELRPWRLGTNWLSRNNKNAKLIEELRNDHFRAHEKYEHTYRKSYRRNWAAKTEAIRKQKEIARRKQRKWIANQNMDLLGQNMQIQKQVSEIQPRRLDDDEEADVSVIFDDMDAPIKPKPPAQPMNIGNIEMGNKHKDLRDALRKIVTPTLSEKIDRRAIDSRHVQAALLLVEELDRDELETIARTIYERLEVNCIPLIINPLHSMPMP